MTNSDMQKFKIKILNIGKDFLNPDSKGILKVLENISLQVLEGNIYSIIGPSGCGKTTLLKIMAGLIPATRGEVIQNRINAKSDRRIMVFQDLHLFDWMTVYKNIEFSFSTRHLAGSEVEQEISDIIKLVGLKGFENYYPHEISGGMCQRLALARALGANPAILLLDEPFSSLDMATKAELEVEFLKLIKSRNITTILVTHDIRQAIYLGDTVIVLSNRPGNIKHTVEVPFMGSRDENLWEQKEFHNLEVQLSKLLKNNV